MVICYFVKIIFLACAFFSIGFNPVQSQSIYQSRIIISGRGSQYSPANAAAQFISSAMMNTFKACAMACNQNTLCRIFDYGAIIPQQCRLFEGDIGTLGTIIPSVLPDSQVGTIQITSPLFTQYGQSCSSVCTNSRYLTCINSTCQCLPHTYWSSTARVCLPQSPILGASCQQGINMCRGDLNYTCLQFNQCGPLSVLSGTTIINRNTSFNGSSFSGLQIPNGVTIYGSAENESLVIVDVFGRQAILMNNANSDNPTISSVISTWIGGTFGIPNYPFIDFGSVNDLYVNDYGGNCVILFSSMQITNPSPRIVAGTCGTSGSGLNTLSGPLGIAVDKQKNLYVADYGNSRIMRWAPNATAGVVIVGTNTTGSDSMSLLQPNGIFLDDNNSLLYVVDGGNNRIQLYHLNGTPPYNGSTVAGGNGQGVGSNQLNIPVNLWVSKKTGTIYIADTYSNRIQRWSKGATSGVTLAGSANGSAGSSSTELNFPIGLVIHANETRMYVGDALNSRVQRFDLI